MIKLFRRSEHNFVTHNQRSSRPLVDI